MPLVVDASALFEYVVVEGGASSFGGFIERADALHIPALCDIEMASALRTLLRTRALTHADAVSALDDYGALGLTRHGHLEFLPRVLELRDNFSAHDAVYIALAEELDAEFLTGDVHLARAVRRRLDLRVLPER